MFTETCEPFAAETPPARLRWFGADHKPISLALTLVCFATLAVPASSENPAHGRGADKADPKTAGIDGPGQGRGHGPDKVQCPGNPGQGTAGAAPAGYQYMRVANDIMLMATGTRLIAGAIAELGAMGAM